MKLSICCHAALVVRCNAKEEGTNYYVCPCCNQPCNFIETDIEKGGDAPCHPEQTTNPDGSNAEQRSDPAESAIPLHEANMEKVARERCHNGVWADLEKGRAVAVFKIKDDDGLALLFNNIDNDGKKTELAFTLHKDAAIALTQCLIHQLK